jgi:hypothetical protein
VDTVVAATTVKGVATFVAADDVVAAAALDDVVAVQARDDIGPARADQLVVARGADDGGRLPVALRRCLCR